MLKPFCVFIILLALSASHILCEEINSPDFVDNPLPEKYEIPSTGLALQHEIVDMQADDPGKSDPSDQSGDIFIAFHADRAQQMPNQINLKLNLVELNPKLVGLTNMAITFLPSNFKFLNVVSATREVINGIRYNLLVNATDETGTELVCDIFVKEKPWLLTEYGDKQRNLERTNCTSPFLNAADRNAELDTNFNPVFVSQGQGVSDDMMRNLESQILQPKAKNSVKKPPLDNSIVSVVQKTSTEKLPTVPVSDGSKSFLDTFFHVQEPAVVTPTTAEHVVTIGKATNGHFAISCTELSHNDDESLENVIATTEHSMAISSDNNENNDVRLENEPIITTPQTAIVSEASLGQNDGMENFQEAYRTIERAVHDNINSEMNYSPLVLPAYVENDDSLLQYVRSELQSPEHQEIQDLPDAAADATPQTEDTDFYPRIDETVAMRFDTSEGDAAATTVIVDEDAEIVTQRIQPTDVMQAEAESNSEQWVRSKRNTNSEKEYVIALAAQAVDQLDHVDSDDYKRIVLDVLHAKRIEKSDQTVYVLKLRVTNSNCAEASTDLAACLADQLDGSTKVCNLEVRVKRVAVQVTKSECSPEKRVQRSLVGAPSALRNDDPEVTELVQQALTTLAGRSDGETYSLDSIESVTSKVVAGISYTILGKFVAKNKPAEHCTMTIWSRSWLNTNDIVLKCDREFRFPVNTSSTTNRVKREFVGGATDISIEDEDLKKKVTDGLASLSGTSDGETYQLTRLTKATQKVVAGILYNVKGEFTKGSSVKTCTMEIWSRAWLNNDDITMTCDEDDKVKRGQVSTSRTRRSLLYDHRTDNSYGFQKTQSEVDTENLFDKFARKYSRTYARPGEREMRLRIFKSNLFVIERLNFHEEGTAKYGITEFADMTSAEYKQRTGLLVRPNGGDSNDIKNPLADIPDNEVPREFDWRDKNVITAVKNQGNCGSCWAFSVTGNIEGLHAIKTGKLEEYSEQELVDCDTMDSGCNGGLPDNAYKAIEQLGGLELESEYPYNAKGGKCSFNKTMSHVKVTGAVDLPKNETAMVHWLVANGPLSIGLNANAMQFYKGGVSHPWRPLCTHSNIDHGVLIVGYGVAEYPLFNKTLPYWIVKNSWGPEWGERGYYRVFRGDNTCGINSMVSSAVLE